MSVPGRRFTASSEGQREGGARADCFCKPRAHSRDRVLGQGNARHDAPLRLRSPDEKGLFKNIPTLRVKKDMVELASHILDRKAGRSDPGEFKDEYELASRNS